MACAFGELAKDCAILHWCDRLGAKREAGEWRAPCPLCGADRAIKFGVHGQGIRWLSYCGEHDRDFLRPKMRELLGDCLPGKSGPAPIDRDELIALALAEVPPMTLRLRMLQMAGVRTGEALDRLGVRRENRPRVIAGKTGGASKRMQKPRSLPSSKWMTPRCVQMDVSPQVNTGMAWA